MKPKLAALARGTRAGATAVTGDHRRDGARRSRGRRDRLPLGSPTNATPCRARSRPQPSASRATPNEAQNDQNREPWTEEEMTQRARMIITANLSYLEGDRLQRALDTLHVTVERSFTGPVVYATADLGGALIAPAFLGRLANIDATWGKSGGGCENITIEFVFALDMRPSMNQTMSSERRIDVAVDTAKTLITDIQRACPNGELRLGIVPWDGTVRLPNPGAADWVDTSKYADPNDWWGVRRINAGRVRVDARGAFRKHPLEDGARSRVGTCVPQPRHREPHAPGPARRAVRTGAERDAAAHRQRDPNSARPGHRSIQRTVAERTPRRHRTRCAGRRGTRIEPPRREV